LDKIGDRLPGWKGKFLSTSGRETLVKTVLSSQPIYHLTVFQAQKWLIKRIDRLRRSFLWRGETPDKVYGGHSLINWPTTCLPKQKGGLGISDLERFARALRLRWLWFQWKQKDRAWNGLDIPCDEYDRHLFNASTIVSVRNGKTASFWNSSWLNGNTPRNIAPTLYKKAKRKQIKVHKAINGDKWIDHITPLSTQQEILEYVELWEAMRGIVLSPALEDEIKWRWTTDGEYTTRSAYCIQFEGVFSRIKISQIWKAKAEPKCRFFAWTLLHKKILTANNLNKRNWQHDPICKLCGLDQETPTHLCKDCSFTKEVWEIMKQWFGISILNPINSSGSLYRYWRKCRARIQKDQRKVFDGVMIYFWWNIWKERNRRTFQQKELQPRQVASLCKEDIQQFRLAYSQFVSSS
jgi:hypothetical protein